MQNPLGEILLRQGHLSASELRMALLQQRSQGLPLGRTLVRDHICSENDVARALSVQAGLAFVDLDRERIDPSAAALVPVKFARERHVVPLRLEQGRHDVLHVAVTAPANVMTVDDVRAAAGKPRVVAYLAADGALARALDRLYPEKGEAAAPAQPAAALAQPERARQGVEAAATAEPAAASQPVRLYGFDGEELTELVEELALHGVSAQEVGAQGVLAGAPGELLIAPLDVIERLVSAGQRLRSSLIAVGADPARDFPRAQALGARGFVATPIDMELLLHTLRRFRPPRKAAG